ncbi:MAG TPA: cysteine desulfurase-like protein [Acidimicrobiia bacterium]|nr:cysteine desulfurase-like protein [Acidimicrobiia bacterium]
MRLDPTAIRSRFPALDRKQGGRPVVWADGPGGTQVPSPVIEAMSEVLSRGASNHGGFFSASAESDEVHEEARRAVADLFGSSPGEIVFGQNMTSLTFALSRAIGRTWSEGDEVVLTRLDHDANVTPWMLAARDAGATVRFADIDTETATLDLDSLEAAVGSNTRLVAVPAASNAVGSLVDVSKVVEIAHSAGALAFVDAVHYAPHGPIDVRAFDCDFLVASAYKFFGPHTGALYGKHDHLERFEAYRLRPAPAEAPGKWETGTQSFESLAGVTAAVDYLAWVGASLTPGPRSTGSRRADLVAAMAATRQYEQMLSRRFLDGVSRIPSVRVYGITDGDPLARTPTFGISVAGVHPDQVAAAFGAEGIFVWSGNYYAVEPIAALGVADDGGLVRIGFVHYNLAEEVDRVVETLARIAS